MKKIMSLMLGLSLLTGAATVAFAQDKSDSEKTGKKGKKGKKGTDSTDKKSDKR
jgi:hypothetical protein